MMKKYKSIIGEISKLIDNSTNIFLASHINPDGDSIGSLMALGLALEQLNKNVHYCKTDTIPKSFEFLPHIDKFRENNHIDEELDLFFILDSANQDRIGSLRTKLEKAKSIINIDHHLDNDNFGHVNLVDSSRSSTGEIVFDLIEGLGLEINKDIASHLYTATSLDSGRFMYDKVDDRTHEIVAELIRTGIDKDQININLYQKRSFPATKLFIEGLSTLKMYNNNTIAIVKISQDLLDKTKANIEETDGLISFIRDIDTVEVACILKEFKEDEIKISIRSKGGIDVSKICNHFNGGGHKRAAGCTIYENIDGARDLIINQINRAME